MKSWTLVEIAFVVIGVLIFVRVGYASLVRGGFQRDVPDFLTYRSLEAYAVFCVIAGIMVTYFASRSGQ